MAGADALCPKAKISGYYTPGTFQQYCIGPVNYVTPIPDELRSADAAVRVQCLDLRLYFSRADWPH